MTQRPITLKTAVNCTSEVVIFKNGDSGGMGGVKQSFRAEVKLQLCVER